jgi:hypothetical protein
MPDAPADCKRLAIEPSEGGLTKTMTLPSPRTPRATGRAEAVDATTRRADICRADVSDLH